MILNLPFLVNGLNVANFVLLLMLHQNKLACLSPTFLAAYPSRAPYGIPL
jgi:hypothetical protein